MTMESETRCRGVSDWEIEKSQPDDPLIFVRLWNKGDYALEKGGVRGRSYDWYAIGGDDSNKKLIDSQTYCISPCFPRQPKNLLFSSCVAMGSKIFVLGGTETYACSNDKRDDQGCEDVLSIDLCNLSRGWTETTPLPIPRVKPLVVSYLGSICVFAACHLRYGYLLPFAESFKNQVWSLLHYGRPIDFPYNSFSHTNLDAERGCILLHHPSDNCLYAYDIESNSTYVFSDNFGKNRGPSALVGGVLYTLDFENPGNFIGFDISKVGCSSIPVSFHPNITPQGTLPMPRSNTRYPYRNAKIPRHYLVALGNQRLAVVWTEKIVIKKGPRKTTQRFIQCSKWKMVKVETERSELMACFISTKRYFVENNGKLESCLVPDQMDAYLEGEETLEDKGNKELRNHLDWMKAGIVLGILAGIAAVFR